MASRTQIVCLCEGARGACIDEVFINTLLKTLKPAWVRAQGSNVVRARPCGGRLEVIRRMPDELKRCLSTGADTTLMVWADCDDDLPESLRAQFWDEAQRQAVTKEQFGSVVFIFAKDRIENWIEYLATGVTEESSEGPRVRHNREAADAARKLAAACAEGRALANMPPSLQWSCRNWRDLVQRMKTP